MLQFSGLRRVGAESASLRLSTTTGRATAAAPGRGPGRFWATGCSLRAGSNGARRQARAVRAGLHCQLACGFPSGFGGGGPGAGLWGCAPSRRAGAATPSRTPRAAASDSETRPCGLARPGRSAEGLAAAVSDRRPLNWLVGNRCIPGLGPEMPSLADSEDHRVLSLPGLGRPQFERRLGRACRLQFC